MSTKDEAKQETEINYGTKCIDKIKDKLEKGERFFSFEFYPPRTAKGVENLKHSFRNMIKWNPQWMDVTWGAGGTTSDLTPEICDFIQNTIKGNCMMHLTCTNMEKTKVDVALKQAKEMGFKNILALRGDPPEGQEKWKAVEGGFECALDLVQYIKQKYGDYFGITVSGYPEGHPLVRKKIDAQSLCNGKYYAVNALDDGTYEGVSEKDWIGELDYLKAKCDAGGQCIITQLFYDAQAFIDWVGAVRAHGITAPIMPGIMPIRNHGSFTRMTGFCKTVIPKDLKQKLLQLKDNTAELYTFGGDYVHQMCQKLLNAKLDDGSWVVPGLHIYTMNTEKCTIELLAKCKIGYNDESFAALINDELKRVLAEDEKKKLQKKEKQKVLEVTKPSDKQEFTEIQSF
eukprot:242385_1